MGLVRAGARAQNVSMYNARRWSDSVVLADMDCGVARDRGGACAAEGGAGSALVEVAGAARRGRCAAECAPSEAAVSVVPLGAWAAGGAAAGGAGANGTFARLAAHNAVFGAVRTERHPLVVAGDTMLVVRAEAGGAEGLAAVRLFDVGRSSMQLAAERLVSTANAHAARIGRCDTFGDDECVARAMRRGEVVLPPSFVQVGGAGAQASGFVLPAASSRFAVHFAANPELAVYQAYFDFCTGELAATGFEVSSSYGRARVWTVQTVRAVDLEGAGEPSAAEVASRVSYMRVPDFFDPREQRSCDVIVGLRVVAVEYLNAENVLVTVLAGRPALPVLLPAPAAARLRRRGGGRGGARLHVLARGGGGAVPRRPGGLGRGGERAVPGAAAAPCTGDGADDAAGRGGGGAGDAA
jgi:hypothetical protein